MVVGVRVAGRGRKGKGWKIEGQGGASPLRKTAEKKASFYSPFETALPGPPPHSLAPIPLAGEGNKAER